MDTELQTACILPLELVENIMEFSKGVTFVWDSDDVANEVVFYKGTQQREARWRTVPLLLTLGLVCRTWLELSRKRFFRNRAVLFDLYEGSELEQISLFCDVLSDRDNLPNLPHILSFIEILRMVTRSGGEFQPSTCQALLAVLLDHMSSQKTYFRPQALKLVSDTALPSHLIQKLTSTFPKITRLLLSTSNNHFHEPADLLQMITSFPELQEVDVNCWLSGENDLSRYRLQDSLHLIRLDLKGLWGSETISLLTEWLQSHPPVHSIRCLTFWSVSLRYKDLIQSFLAICPELECLWIISDMRYVSHYAENVMDAFFDLKDLTHLECLGFQMIPIARRSNDSTAIINFIARTLQTVKSSGTSVQVILSLRASELSLCDWSPVDQAISETPRDVTLEIRALVPSLDKENEQEVVTTTVGVKFPKSQERSRVIVRFEEFGVGIPGLV